ncbi:MAG: hypothetical protein KAH17_08115 [Bacteroidales bacterium]|nr:hypothetical protein [Bacteroidales bacterium]
MCSLSVTKSVVKISSFSGLWKIEIYSGSRRIKRSIFESVSKVISEMRIIIYSILTASVFLFTNCIKELVETEPDGVFTDARDDQEYPYVVIGNQTWMMKNLAYAADKGSWVYDEKDKFIPDYGRLYNFDAAVKACPKGWHLPSDSDWKNLEMYLGMDPHSADSVDWRRSGDVAIPIKNTAGWYSGGNGNNDSKFTALPGGFRTPGGVFFFMGDVANYWTSSYTSETHAWGRAMMYYESGVYRFKYDKQEAFSVRCLKN